MTCPHGVTSPNEECAPCMLLALESVGRGVVHRDLNPANMVDVSGLEPDAVLVVELLVSRLRAGREKYGPLNLDAKDWNREASEEAIDGFAYLAFETLRRSRR